MVSGVLGCSVLFSQTNSFDSQGGSAQLRWCLSCSCEDQYSTVRTVQYNKRSVESKVLGRDCVSFLRGITAVGKDCVPYERSSVPGTL